MLVVVSACLLLWCHRSAAVEAELAPPSMLTMITLNTHYTMSWEWDQRAAESDAVTFTTQYVAKYKLKSKKGPNWSKMCNETSERSCDLTALNLHYLGIYMLRVRASVNGQHSVWVQKEFCPDKDARVGPPASVNLSPADRSLEVLISDPLTSTNGSMKEHLPKLYYSILYWDRSVETEAVSPQTLSSSVSTVTLSELKAWTWYCVAVQTRYDFYNKSSAFTPPHCMQTEGAIPWWYIFVCFLASLMIWFLGSLLSIYGSFWCFRSYKATFFPQLPPSLKEYIDGSPGSGIPHHLDSDSQLELLCENVTVCPQPAILEVPSAQAEAFPAPTPDLDPDSSGRHSRQDSSTSGDSGVYSTGGTSGALLPSINQCFTSTGDGWTGPLDPERVKMHTRVDVQSTSEDRIQTDAGLLEMCSMPVIHVS